MERTDLTKSILEKWLARWGKKYIFRAHLGSLFISGLFGVIGIYYVLAAAGMTRDNDLLFAISFILLLSLANFLIPFFTTYSTKSVNTQLELIQLGEQSQDQPRQEQLVQSSWKEVQTISTKLLMAEIATFSFLVVLPLVFIMRTIGSVGVPQAIHITIGALLSVLFIAIHNTLLTDRLFVPVRQILSIGSENFLIPTFGLKIRPRVFGIIVFLVFTTLIMLGGIGFQKSINTSLPGANVPLEIAQFQTQAIISSALVLFFGVILGSMITSSFSLPLREISNALDNAQKGDLSARAKILSSDEVSFLTIRLNQLLNQLRNSQINLESQVEQRTSDLNRKTSQLQASARVLRDSSSAKDVASLLSSVVDLISSYFGFYHTGIYLVDPTQEFLSLQAASSEGGKKMIARGHKIEVGQRGIIGAVAYESRPHIVTEFNRAAYYQENQDLPLTKSQIALPLSIRGKLVGVLDIQSALSSAFNMDDMDLLQTLSDQVALAIDNTQLMEESRLTLEKLEASLTESVRQSWGTRTKDQKRSFQFLPTGTTPTDKDTDHPAARSDVERISIPISLRGIQIGNIILSRKGEDSWGTSDRSLAAEVANQIGLALENSRLLQDTQQRAFYEQTISDLSARLGRAVDADSLLQIIVRELHQLPNVTEVSAFLTPPSEKKPGEISLP